MNKIAAFTFFMLMAFCSISYGQIDRVKFWANSRGFQQNARLEEKDTVNTSKYSSGYVLGDLGVNINPLKNTEIQAIMRLRADLGGFYSNGSTVTLRRLNVKGLIANVVSYEVGDMYLKLSPYTLFNTNSEGQVNEATVFRNLRQDIVNYDLFYRENYWWQQGAHVNFETGFRNGIIDKIKYDAFVTRIQASPTMRLSAGGRIAFMSKDKFNWAFNYINVFDERAVNPYQYGITNPVVSSEIMYNLTKGDNQFVIGGEGGYSALNYNKPLKGTLPANVKTNYEDFFVDGYLGFNIPKDRVKIKLGYRYVGPDFRSTGAQTKRVNFAGQPEFFMSVANDPFTQRQVNLFDITRSTSVYNVVLTPQLMAYDPSLTNTMPYGVATPNRQGVYLEATKDDSSKVIGGGVKAYYMRDAVGYGAVEKRHFQLYRATLDLRLHNLLKLSRHAVLYGGVQYERTKRDGASPVKLNSILLDAGLDLEILKRFYLVGGAKILNSKGNEFLLPVDQFNQFTTPIVFNGNTVQQLFGYGLKYQFGANTYLTVQNQNFIYKNKDNTNRSYSFDQFFIMFFMKM